jgi:nucleoside-diphosphate-sugar epimerase
MECDINTATLIIGKRSNLSSYLYKKVPNVIILSTEQLSKSLSCLDKYEKINIVFNNFQPSSKVNDLSSPLAYINTSFLLTINIVNYIITNNILINKIIYTSSSSVYGDTELSLESNTTSPQNVYSFIKRANEEYLLKICTDNCINLTIARVFNMFGGTDIFSVVSKIINCCSNNKELTIVNKGLSVRSYIHVSDVAKIYKKILCESYKGIRIMNVSSGFHFSVHDLLSYANENGYHVVVKNINRNEIPCSISDMKLLNSIIDTSDFVNVKDYIVRKISSI